MNVAVITIGDELLLGFTIDTNAAFLSRHLSTLGIAVTRRVTCGDSPDDIVAAVREALDRTGAVITTGGLGPTSDDRTKATIAELFGRRMIVDTNVEAQITELWRTRGRGTPPEAVYQQALVPEGATVLQNHHGTAPGLWLEDDRGRWVAMLPGVPREMRGLYRDALEPLLRDRVGDNHNVVRSKTIRTVGVAESILAEQLGEHASGIGDLSLAYLPNPDGVDLRLTARGMTPEAADRALHDAAAIVRSHIGDVTYGEDDTDLAAVVLDLCRREHLRLAVAESCTGGLLGARITAIPGASDVFHGGLIAYDNRVKRQLLGVLDSDLAEQGAVSEPVALQMAKGIRIRLGTEIGVAITGIAGPDGGTPEKPVGTVWIALDVAEGRPPIPRPEGRPPIPPFQRARLFRLIGDRGEIRHRAAQAALEFVRQAVFYLQTQLQTQ